MNTYAYMHAMLACMHVKEDIMTHLQILCLFGEMKKETNIKVVNINQKYQRVSPFEP